MIFTTVTREAQIYGQGTCIGKERFEIFSGVKMFFYDRKTIEEEFENAGLLEISEVKDVYPFYFIKCSKAGVSG
jgi:hypothetical protein